jgi:xanthine dehydrogenase accessory factor
MDSVDLEVLRSVQRWLGEGRAVALVTVVKTWGSSPRPVGALLAVVGDGRFVGSVSGGCVEEDLVARLREGIPARPETVTYGVTADEARRFGLPCGGTLQLVVEPLRDAESLAPVLEALEQRQTVARTLDLASGRAVIAPAPRGQTPAFDGARLTAVYGPRWRLLIIGAGQLSRYLAEFAQAMDYQVVVCDPREDYADQWSVAGAELTRGMPDDVVRELGMDPQSALVALTHDPKLDDMALMEALKSDAFYVGALGSKANNEKRRRRLAQFDLGPEQLARLRGPVGLPLGGRTPPEIAIAVLAEITALRNGIELVPATETASSAAEPVFAAGG